eukprot:TRINITY_DN11683_c0_g1_i1.p1 TRINITY_DN11683_c0_g1~~TRINITY_DN11683_c0_g1_i1.p1  ORF type:complete len:787 (-),score=227.26 TRINITY_DN11683_c0_g1_i1:11-2371(-)
MGSLCACRRGSSRSGDGAETSLLNDDDEDDDQHGSFAIHIIDNKGVIDDFYDIEEEKIGEGSFGRVCRCTNRSTGSTRAVKILRKVRRKSQQALFKAELTTLKELDHPYVVALHEHFEDAKFLYMVMEFCSGGELYDKVVEVGHFSESQSAIIMQQIFRAIYYLHTMQVVHRDLKMENFMFASESPVEANQIKVIDFGFARHFRPQEAMHTKCGQPYFVSPQMLAGRYHEACDIWSLGVNAYILICGYPPFYGDSDAEVLSRVRTGNFSFNDADWRHISEAAKDLIRGMLRMNEGERVTAKQALFDVWLTQKAPVLRAPLKQKYVENMRKYVKFNRFKQASLRIIVSQLEPELLKPLIDTFMWLDTTGDGLIAGDEIASGMRRAGWTEVEIPEDLNELVAEIDSDGSGEIGLGEFVASCLDLQIYAREEVCWAAFRIYDQNGDGKIGVTDLHMILNNGQPEGEEVVSKWDCKDMIFTAAQGESERVSFNQFMDMMKRSTQQEFFAERNERKSLTAGEVKPERNSLMADLKPERKSLTAGAAEGAALEEVTVDVAPEEEPATPSDHALQSAENPEDEQAGTPNADDSFATMETTDPHNEDSPDGKRSRRPEKKEKKHKKDQDVAELGHETETLHTEQGGEENAEVEKPRSDRHHKTKDKEKDAELGTEKESKAKDNEEKKRKKKHKDKEEEVKNNEEDPSSSTHVQSLRTQESAGDTDHEKEKKVKKKDKEPKEKKEKKEKKDKKANHPPGDTVISRAASDKATERTTSEPGHAEASEPGHTEPDET